MNGRHFPANFFISPAKSLPHGTGLSRHILPASTSHPFPFHSISMALLAMSMAMGQSDDILWSSYSLSIYPPFIVSTPDIKQIIFSLLLNYLEFGLAGHSRKENHLNITCHISPYHHEKEKVVEW
jgi:hypothetical protein